MENTERQSPLHDERELQLSEQTQERANTISSIQKPEKRLRFRLYVIVGVFIFVIVTTVSIANLLSHQAGQTTTTNTSVEVPITRTTITSTPVEAPIRNDHHLNVTLKDGVLYTGAYNKAVYAIRADNGTLLWHFQTNGDSSMPPVVVDGTVYVGAYIFHNNPQQQSDTLYALRASDGKVLWNYRVQGNIYAPQVVNGIVYISSLTGITALHAGNGQKLWHFSTTQELNRYSLTDVVDGVVYAYGRSENSYTSKEGEPAAVFALRARDGRQIWKHQTTGLYDSRVLNGKVYFASGVYTGPSPSGSMTALHARDGKVLWQQSMDEPDMYTLVEDKGTLYLASTKYTFPGASTTLPPPVRNMANGYTTHCLMEQTGPCGRTQSFLAAPLRQMIPHKMGDSSLYALRSTDGTIVWHKRLSQDGTNWVNHLSLLNEVIYISVSILVTNSTDKAYIAALNSRDGSQLWKQMSDHSFFSNIFTSDTIYTSVYKDASHSEIRALRTKDGTQQWSYSLTGTSDSTFVLDDSLLYVSAANGVVYAVEKMSGREHWRYLTN